MTESRKLRLAVVSPTLDKRHGTERLVVEWISRLTSTFDVHVFSQEVEDLDLRSITWHRIPKIPGPHLFNYLWWFFANRLWRAANATFKNLEFDLVYSPGVNCSDADVMSVHIVFPQYLHNISDELDFSRHSLAAWPRLLHRKIYYALISALERRYYRPGGAPLVLIAKRTADELARFYNRRDNLSIVYIGLDHSVFNPQRRRALRDQARNALSLSSDRFALILVGNDWLNKGVPTILKALAQMKDDPIDLLLVSREDPERFRTAVRDAGLDGRVHLVPPRADIEFYYAAADAYLGPSLEDTFALPPQEAMACGLPVIVSSANGTSEIFTDGVNGLILPNSTDAQALGVMIRSLRENPSLATQMGEAAAETALRFTWESNAAQFISIFQSVAERKRQGDPRLAKIERARESSEENLTARK